MVMIDTRRRLLCYAKGTDGDWEAICVDLDIAVDGHSLEDVKARLYDAVKLYAESAIAEGGEAARDLLNRKAPIWVRLQLVASFLAHLLSGRRDDDGYQAGFDMSCPA
jgi:predicted RNase H-like HicB family nuclease